MAKGSCLCGGVAFDFDDAGVVVSVACYCANCRKVSGSAYGIYLQVKTASFRWLAGADQVATYESSPGNQRGFCRTCGSIAPVQTSYGAVRVPGGALDENPGIVPDVVLFSESEAAWCSASEASRTFVDTGPPDFWGEMVRRLFGVS